MKAILEFNLPEEQEEFDTSYKAILYKCVIQDFRNYMRNRMKYGNIPSELYKALEEINDKFFEICQESGIEL